MITPARNIPAGQAAPPRRPTEASQYLPLAIDMDGLRCLVVGGGRIGTRKALRLAGAGADVTVLAPEISFRLRRRVRQGDLRWRQDTYAPAALENFAFVVAATADPELNVRIRRDAEARRMLCCVVSPGRLSRVIFPAVHRDGNMTLAVHTDGEDCRRSQRLRNRIASWLRTGRGPWDGVEPAVRPVRPRPVRPSPQPGKVYLVGAGPGAPDLITVRGYHALSMADVVLADQLVPPTFLDDLGILTEGKIVEWLGDAPPRPSQATINRRLVEHALTGKTVVRLKGGDPFVFGRGDAEIDHLDKHGIPWEVIPGCSSATAALTAAGLPLTRHGKGRSFAVATARVTGGGLAAAFPRADTLVILMGVGVLDEIVERLLADGWPPDSPAAVVERGTLPWERRVKGPLAQLGRVASEAGIASPALIVVGEGARGVRALDIRPTVLFTGRDPAHLGELGNLLHWPALAEGPEGDLGEAHPELGRPLPEHDVIYFESPAGVRAYWEAYGPAAFRREVWCLDGPTHEALSRRRIPTQWVNAQAAPAGVRVSA